MQLLMISLVLPQVSRPDLCEQGRVVVHLMQQCRAQALDFFGFPSAALAHAVQATLQDSTVL